MISLPINEETLAIARRMIWFEPPDVALSNGTRFMAYAFRYASHEDMRTLRRHVTDEDLSKALEAAPPGIIDGRSWAYWNWIIRNLTPPPPLPRRGLSHAV